LAAAIHNRFGLERRACECYAISKREFESPAGQQGKAPGGNEVIV
jgi:hypothetical protein